MFGKYLQKHNFLTSAVFELKIEKTKRFAFNKVKDHQIIGLKQAETGLYQKISDSPIFSGQKTRFTAKKPFDCFYLKKVAGYIVIWFYVPRKLKRCWIIEVNDFRIIRENWHKKSITEKEIEEIWADNHFDIRLRTFALGNNGI